MNKKEKLKLVSVIIPAYKQEKTIVKDLKRIKRVLDQLRYPTEIICVVDGFVDKTYQKAKKLERAIRNLKVVGYVNNKGKGYAIRFGMAQSKGEIVAYIDSGMDLNPNGLSMLLEHFEWYKADIIVGSKRHPASRITYPWQRRILSFSYQMVVYLFFHLRIRDTQVGMKFYRREVIQKVLPRLLVKAFAFEIEMLAVAHYLGFRKIYEAPVEAKLNFGKGSSVTDRRFLKTVAFMLLDTLAVFYRLRILNYYSYKNHRKWRYDPDLNFRVNLG